MSEPGADRFAQRVFLLELPHPRLKARYSQGARRRSAQLQGFLGALEAALSETSSGTLDVTGPAQLLVLGRKDWQARLGRPYGLPLALGGTPPSVVAPAEYPERLLRRYDGALLVAARRGVRAPGDLRELFDLLLALEWAQTALRRARLRSRSSWLNELAALVLLLGALRAADYEGAAERLLAWGRLGLAGLEGAPLADYRYPRAHLSPELGLYFLGKFLELAEPLSREGGAFLRTLGEALAQGDDPVPGRLDACLEPWLASFAPETDAGS